MRLKSKFYFYEKKNSDNEEEFLKKLALRFRKKRLTELKEKNAFYTNA